MRSAFRKWEICPSGEKARYASLELAGAGTSGLNHDLGVRTEMPVLVQNLQPPFVLSALVRHSCAHLSSPGRETLSEANPLGGNEEPVAPGFAMDRGDQCGNPENAARRGKQRAGSDLDGGVSALPDPF